MGYGLETFRDLVASSVKPILVFFFADWCAPSKLQKPIIEKMQSDLKDRAEILLFDADTDEELADHLEIRNLPTTIIYAKGELVEILPGFQQEDFLRSYLEYILSVLQAEKK